MADAPDRRLPLAVQLYTFRDPARFGGDGLGLDIPTLSAIAAVQGNRVRVVDPVSRQLARTLNEALAPKRSGIAAFMETGGLRRAAIAGGPAEP